jgi:type IV pilus assembly protein PilB
MPLKNENKLKDILVQLKLLTPEQLDLVKIESARSGKPFDQVVLDLNLLNEESLTKARAISLDVPYVDLSEVKVDQNVLKNLSKELAKKYLAVPFALNAGNLSVAMTDPNNVQVIEFIEKKGGMPVTPYLASQEGIEKVILQYQDISSEVSEALKNVEVEPSSDVKEVSQISDMMQDAPVTRAVNTILEYAARAKASDVHIEPREKNVKIR